MANGRIRSGFIPPDDPQLEGFLFDDWSEESEGHIPQKCRGRDEGTLQEKYRNMRNLPQYLTHADYTAPKD